MRRTKIICTIGPASESQEVLVEMINAGMDVARLNFSHGTHAEHLKRVDRIRKASELAGKQVAIILDTKGPEIRIGSFKNSPITLKNGSTFILTTEEIEGTQEKVSVSYKKLPQQVRPGDSILINDGLIELKVEKVENQEIICLVVVGGELSDKKGVNLPGITVDLPILTEKDYQDLQFAVEHKLDFIAASFIRTASDVLAIRKVLEDAGGENIQIIAKIESKQGVDNIDQILEVADGIMVARGDLGVEIPSEEVPLVQKDIIKRCNVLGKPVIIATQMLESMTNNPRPTRAEVTDIANAIMDGTDAIMLSGETAAGKYPLQAVKVMAKIAERTDRSLPYGDILLKNSLTRENNVTSAISFATCQTAYDLDAAAIITATKSGHTARMVSKYRPKALIIASTPHEEVVRQLRLVWGVYPLLGVETGSTDEMIDNSVNAALKADLIKQGDLVVITAGLPANVTGTTNLLKVHTVGHIFAKGIGVGRTSVSGRVCVAKTAAEALEKVERGDILVTIGVDAAYVPVFNKIVGLVTEEGGLTSPGAIMGLQYGIPVIVGVEKATDLLSDTDVITIDGEAGLIYRGKARVK
ncbi:MAG TPA: pyruvate kinase [Clostridia bacterium]|nr:pyruvate kinase [Clostridia bacterium]